MSHRIIFIDSNVAEYQSLIPQLPEDLEVIVLGASKDGVIQILDALQGKTEIGVIDIISHGAPGALMLGSIELSNANLAEYAEQFTQIGMHLSDTADILFYGCEVAQGRPGQAFIEQLSLLTGANVAASTNLTGAGALGGDWILEAHTGLTTANALQLSYSEVLGFDAFKVNASDRSADGPSATALSNGGFVVSWVSSRSTSGDIYAQRYDANGVAQGGDFRVNTSTEGLQSSASIVGLSNGGFVVNWNDNSRNDFYAQRYDANGVVQGGEFRVGGSSGGGDPLIAGLSDGGFVVSWIDHGSFYAQRYDVNGVAQGGELKVIDAGGGDPSIAGLSDGGFVVSWYSLGAYDVYAQRYDANGVAQGGKFVANTSTVGTQWDPLVAGLSNGGFVVSWYDHAFHESSERQMAQLYDANGIAQGVEFQISSGSGGGHPSIAALSDGGFVWVEDGAWAAHRFDANGVAQGWVAIHSDLSFSGYSAVAGLPNDGFVTFWSSSDGINGVRFDANNNEVAPGSSGVEPADRLFNWAESIYTDLFPNHATSQEIAGYHARLYENGNALGEQSSNIYFYDGHSITLVGTVDDFLPGAVAAGF